MNNDVLYNFVNSPEEGLTNFNLAEEYYNIRHYAGAVSHYLRTAEYGEDTLLIYESLLKLSLCFKNLGDRSYIESGWLLHAISLCPERPEAYWLLSMFYELHKNWQECYTISCIGLERTQKPSADSKLKIGIGYEGEYMLLFQKAIAAWWIGRCQEARDILCSLPDYPLNNIYRTQVQANLSRLGSSNDPFLPYTKDKAEGLRYKFKEYDKIDKNYSQTYQDMFVLSMLDGKKNGWYLEIGSADPFWGSNTCLLEREFEWKGISIEFLESEVNKFRTNRTNPVICRDAATINYSSFLKGINAPKNIDYLQLDCEPPETTYNILLSIPFETYKFAVITFEHDYYADVTRRYRDLSRNFLKEQGYILVVNNIAPNDKSSFEDWWVYPDLIDREILDKMLCVNDMVKNAEKYMLNDLK